MFNWQHVKMNRKKPLKVIIVGLPRSGTSFLTSLVSYLSEYNMGSQEYMRGADINNKYGYFEFVPLMNLTNKMLGKLNGGFHNIPDLPCDWMDVLSNEMNELTDIVLKHDIQLYKDNRLMAINEVYSHLFPDAKWIFIERDIKETYKSRFGKKISFEDWEKITSNRMEAWNRGEASTKALNLNYKMFFKDFRGTLLDIANHLELDDVENKIEDSYALFKPSKGK